LKELQKNRGQRQIKVQGQRSTLEIRRIWLGKMRVKNHFNQKRKVIILMYIVQRIDPSYKRQINVVKSRLADLTSLQSLHLQPVAGISLETQ